MYRLYYYPLNASMAPHFLLEEMGVNYELALVDRKANSQKSEEYLALNPTGRIPTLVDGDLVIFESVAICLYLCEQNPDSLFIPNIGDAERANFYQWLMYLNNTLQAELMIYFYPEKHTTDKNALTHIIDAQEIRVTEMFALLDKQLEGRSFLIGEQITVCDYFLFMLAVWADEFKKPPLAFTNLSRYLKNMASRPAIKRVCEKENLNLRDYA